MLLTPEGREQAEAFLVQQEQARTGVEAECLTAVQERRFRDAARAMAAYEAQQVFPRGLGIDWSKPDLTRYERVLGLIFFAVPSILKGLEPEHWEPLRTGAAMMTLWGTARCRKWLPEGLETGVRLDNDTAARMILFHATHLQNLQSYRQLGVKKVSVSTAGVNSCPICRNMEGKTFSIDRVPELPHPSCTYELGCRCMVVAEFDSR